MVGRHLKLNVAQIELSAYLTPVKSNLPSYMLPTVIICICLLRQEYHLGVILDSSFSLSPGIQCISQSSQHYQKISRNQPPPSMSAALNPSRSSSLHAHSLLPLHTLSSAAASVSFSSTSHFSLSCLDCWMASHCNQSSSSAFIRLSMIWSPLVPLSPSLFSAPFPFTLPQWHQSVCLQNILSSFTAQGLCTCCHICLEICLLLIRWLSKPFRGFLKAFRRPLTVESQQPPTGLPSQKPIFVLYTI